MGHLVRGETRGGCDLGIVGDMDQATNHRDFLYLCGAEHRKAWAASNGEVETEGMAPFNCQSECCSRVSIKSFAAEKSTSFEESFSKASFFPTVGLTPFTERGS